LSRKKIVETERWDDLQWGEHSHAFTVAHSRNADVLNDIAGFMNTALAEGESFETFRDKLRDLMIDKGWYGRQDKGPDDEDYINWRTRLIYHTNMSTAYSAGHYRQQMEAADLMPIWEYVSQLTGDYRREDHLALHGKAFRYDDPFWNDNYPKNGWGCECEVIAHSISGAARDGIEILSSDGDGNPPEVTGKDGKPIDWEKFTDPDWAYNPGREAIAPDFESYKNLADFKMEDGRTALAHVIENYRNEMDKARMTEGEFNTVLRRTNKEDFRPFNINYQVGNLEQRRFSALRAIGMTDSKIMATDHDLWHGTGDKREEHKVPADLFTDVYKTLGEPEIIYMEKAPKKSRQNIILHLVKTYPDGKKLKIVVHVKKFRITKTAMQIRTMGYADYRYWADKYDEIKW
jgi:SPP1 gp7 family putative phage head morphogenesis protein